MKRQAFSFAMDKGWEQYNRATDAKRFKRKFQRHRKKALDALAKKMVKEIVDAGGFEANAPLTKMIKNSSKPLVHTGKTLSKAITTKMINRKSLFVGVLNSDKFYQQAVAIHEGTLIKVTPAMRGMFMLLWLASIGKEDPSNLTGRAKELWDSGGRNWAPLSPGTSAIKIPSRPFIQKAFLDPAARNFALMKFSEAVDNTIKELVAKG